MGILKKKPTVAPSEGDKEAKGVRRFVYEVDLDAKLQPGQLPWKCVFEGPWSRHSVDTMLKHAIRGLKLHKKELLKEAEYVRTSEDYRPTSSRREGSEA